MNLQEQTEKIKLFAKELGFTDCGIAAASKLESDAIKLQEWLNNGYAAEMQYMHNHFEKRIDPQLLEEGTKSIIVVLQNYFPKDFPFANRKYKISRYALGRDYHKVLKKKLKALFERINTEITPVKGRFFTDSAPILERAWARKAGLGWIGKNSLLLTKTQGSYFFIGIILVDIPLHYDTPINEYCGNCARCLEACPTNAIAEPKIVDARKCISYHTIESMSTIPDQIKKMQQNWIFGCDICQEVCPWNKQSLPHSEPELSISKALSIVKDEDFENLNQNSFENIAFGSPLKRAGFDKLKNTIQTLHH